MYTLATVCHVVSASRLRCLRPDLSLQWGDI